jgi:hypothetical protein
MSHHHHHHHDHTGTCPACDYGPFVRNAYWTGKLMLARDFTDEQRYVIDRFRHHNQRLHGSGVVCGLKVVPHENPECRARFVCVQPGSAIDCCGHDILVLETAVVDLWASLPSRHSKTRRKTPIAEICIQNAHLRPGSARRDECGWRRGPLRAESVRVMRIKFTCSTEPDPPPPFQPIAAIS